MSRGQPDFGQYAVKEISASISDMGEVAARLGSINIYDKRGEVVDFDSFEEPVLKWRLSDAVTGEIAFVTDNCKSGSQALKLTRILNKPISVQVYKSYSILLSKRLGAEISFATLSPAADLRVEIKYSYATGHLWASLKLDNVNHKLYVEDETWEYTEVSAIADLYNQAFYFYTLKLVVDFDTKEYVRLLFANQEYDLSGIRLGDTGISGNPDKVEVFIGMFSATNPEQYVVIDNYIMTQAEP